MQTRRTRPNVLLGKVDHVRARTFVVAGIIAILVGIGIAIYLSSRGGDMPESNSGPGQPGLREPAAQPGYAPRP